MNRRTLLSRLALLSLGSWTLRARGADAPVTLPAKDRFHIYLLIGQSNMAGRGDMTPGMLPPERVVKLDKDDQWVPAVDPLHFDKPTIAGVGPGSGFGPAMAAAFPDATIGLIPSAFGGTPLSRWERGGDLYQNALRRVRIAQEHGTLRGVIWHQGENDSSRPESAATYGERFYRMIADLRADLKFDVPFVAGELGQRPEMTEPYRVINQALGALPKHVPLTRTVESRGLTFKSDKIHFDAESSREFGRRYAAAMQALLRESAGSQ